MLDVPFISWFSPSYRKLQVDKVAQLQANHAKKAMLDDYFHYVLDMMSIESPAYHADKSLFSPSYKSKKRLVYGMDYDAKYVTDVANSKGEK